MAGDNESLSSITLEQWCADAKVFEQVIFIRNTNQALCLAHRESSVRWCFAAGWQGLIALRPGLEVLSGSAEVWPLLQTNIVKLQLFIDKGADRNVQVIRGEPWAALRSEECLSHGASDFKFWYLKLALQGRLEYQFFADKLRCSEGYLLLDFLLERGSSSEKLQYLARRYGVSVSHFRRLGRQALGGPMKTELREWRAARALLEITKRSGSMMDIAMGLGYASSSHFSKDIRELLGVAPAGLNDITRYSSERVDNV